MARILEKSKVIYLALAAAGVCWTFQSNLQVLVLNGTKYIFPKLGPSLTVSPTNVLDVISLKTRIFDTQLSFDATSAGWPLPAGATDVVIYVNGLRYHAGLDYQISNNIIKPFSGSAFDPSYVVTCDYAK